MTKMKEYCLALIMLDSYQYGISRFVTHSVPPKCYCIKVILIPRLIFKLFRKKCKYDAKNNDQNYYHFLLHMWEANISALKLIKLLLSIWNRVCFWELLLSIPNQTMHCSFIVHSSYIPNAWNPLARHYSTIKLALSLLSLVHLCSKLFLIFIHHHITTFPIMLAAFSTMAVIG